MLWQVPFYLNLFLGGIVTVIGLLTWIWAPRKGPNSRWGIRLPYTFQSRQVWDRVNRVGGLALSMSGILLLLPANLLVPAAGTQGMLTVIWMALTLPLDGAGIRRYARRVAQETVFNPSQPGIGRSRL